MSKRTFYIPKYTFNTGSIYIRIIIIKMGKEKKRKKYLIGHFLLFFK